MVAGVCVTRWSAQPPAGPPGPPMDPPGMPPGRPNAVQGIKPAWLTAPQQPQPQAQMWPPARPAPPGNGYPQDPPPPPPQQYIPQQPIQVRACPPSISMHGMRSVCLRPTPDIMPAQPQPLEYRERWGGVQIIYTYPHPHTDNRLSQSVIDLHLFLSRMP